VIDLAQSDEIEKQKKTRPWGEPYLRQPWDVLSLEIKKLYNKGIRDFLIKINAHGDAEGFTFGKLSFPALRMFMLMHSDFPNCRFTLEMMSCYGGGMENYFSKIGDDKDAEPGRITMILQTKPDTINLSNVSRYGNGDQERTYVISAYDAAKARGLILGKPSDPYGQLHLNADEFAKLQQYTDAEAWRMQRFGEGPKRTASLGTGDSHGSLAVKSSRREDLLPRRIKHYQPPAKSYTDRRTLSRHTKRRRR
jgi:hypothetical protein